MNQQGPFTRSDLEELGEFYATARAVVTMREVHAGNRAPDVIGVRHDVDNHQDALQTAVNLARWEAENGWRSTYFLLHTAGYWKDGRVFGAADEIAELGHEIGLHVDGLADSLLHGGDPHEKVSHALEELRSAGHSVTGVVGHGNGPVCHVAGFANDEMFVECCRLRNGDPDRVLRYDRKTLRIEPRPMADYGIDYDAVWLRHYDRDGDGELHTRPNQLYNTDSGGRWYYPFEKTVRQFRELTDGQLHLLQHPDHWSAAFVAERVGA